MRNATTFSHLRKKRRFSFERIVSGLLQPLHMTYSSTDIIQKHSIRHAYVVLRNYGHYIPKEQHKIRKDRIINEQNLQLERILI